MASCYNSNSTNLPQPVGLTAIVRSRTIVAGQAVGFPHPAAMKTKTTTEERFWSKVDRNGPIPAHRQELGNCWIWTGVKDSWGYGAFIPEGKKQTGSHRYAFYKSYVPAVKGKMVLHHCDNPACVRPSHLFEGTAKRNSKDREARNRGNHPTGFRTAVYTHPEMIKYGEECRFAKLTWAKVSDIRKLLDNGWSRKMVAQKFGVSVGTIRLIEIKETWK